MLCLIWLCNRLLYLPFQNLLRLSLGAAGAGVSPDAGQLQSHSLPSSVSDALEAMGMEDLNLEELDPGGLRDDPQEVNTHTHSHGSHQLACEKLHL